MKELGKHLLKSRLLAHLVSVFGLISLGLLIGCGSTGVVTPTTTTGSSGPLTAPSSVLFGNVAVGGSASQTLSFANPATNSAVTVSSLQVSGSGFSLTQQPVLPATIPPGQSASVTIQASPTGSGPMTGSLSIVSNASPSTIVVNLSATGVITTGATFAISGVISPAALAFGVPVTISGSGLTPSTVTADSTGAFAFSALPAGSYTVTPAKANTTFAPASQQLTITNANLTGINFAMTFSISGSLTNSGAGATVTLTAGGNQQVTADANGNYSFTGLSAATYTVTPSKNLYTFVPAQKQVTISAGNVAAVNFSTAPGQLSINPVSFNFGNVNVGSSSQSQSGTLTATNGDLIVTAETINTPGFTISGLTFPIALSSGQSTAFSMAFTPASAGNISATLSFSNASAMLATASLSGSAVGLQLSPGNLSLGQVLDGTTSSQTVTLTAVGASVSVTSATLTQNGGGGSAFSITGLPAFPFTIAAGLTQQFNVTFAPAAGAPGTAAGTISFATNANAVVQNISGTGVPNVLLGWSPSSTPSVSYNVYRCAISSAACVQSSPGNFNLISTGINGLGYTDGIVTSGQTYYYAVTAVANGTESVFSQVTSGAVIP